MPSSHNFMDKQTIYFMCFISRSVTIVGVVSQELIKSCIDGLT